MTLEENRNCNSNNMQVMPTMSNIMTNNSISNTNINVNMNCDLKEEMLHQIMSYDFSINELALYLDTHNDDERALCLHNRYCKIAKDLKDKYQKIYGPLTIEYPCNKWRWIEEPWPWERGNF